jgi:hypothetical protein
MRFAVPSLALVLAACADFSTEGDWQTGDVPEPSPEQQTPTSTPTATPTGTPQESLSGLLINEFLLFPPAGSSAADDVNRDGVVDDDDRFIEVVNDSGEPMALADIQITIQIGGNSQSTDLGPGTLAHGKAAVLYAGSAPPANEACGSILLPNMIGNQSPNNGQMTVTLTTPTSSAAVAWTFDSNASATRGPDLSGDFVDHPESTDHANIMRRNSPGCRADWTPF